MDEEHSHWLLHNNSATARVPINGQIAGPPISVNGILWGLDFTQMPPCPAQDKEIRRNNLQRILPGWSDGTHRHTRHLLPSSMIPAKAQAFLDFITLKLDPI